MSVAAGFDGRGIASENVVQGARGSGVEPRVRWQHDKIRAKPERLADRHSPFQAGQPCFG
jgi:hypothetical protein